MPNRATPQDVRSILTFDSSIANLSPFIDMANELVTELCLPVAAYSDRRLKQIETLLAAHFICIRDPRYTSEHIGQASVTYQAHIGPNLELTPYGMQAQVLDTNGSLAWIDKHISQGKRAKPGIVWLGTKCLDKRWNFAWKFYAAFGGYPE